VSSAPLAKHVEDWRIAVDERLRAGMVCPERKEEQDRGLLRGGVLSERGRRSPSRTRLDFMAHGRRSAGDTGSPKNE
jgi:hypothetical protein